MEVNINQLISHYNKTSIKVKGVYHYKIDPGSSGSQISAPFPGFIFPIRGKARFKFDGTQYEGAVGTVIHGGTAMEIEKEVVGQEHWEYMLILYEIISEDTKELSLAKSHFQLKIGSSPLLHELLWKIWNAYNQPGAMPSFQANVLLMNILEEMFFAYRKQTKDDAEELYEKIEAYMRYHYKEVLSLKTIADLFEINENRLFYIFKKYSQLSPGDYLMTYRLNRAKEMLVITEGAISDISRNVGYVDPLYFSRIFKKKVGCSPSVFREKFRKNPYIFQETSIP